MKVFRKKSTFKDGKDWFSATRSDGTSLNIVFKCPVETESVAFEISDVVGTSKTKEVVKNGETYVNCTYYVTSCKFSEIVGEELPL